ncbi:MAG: hypothetical protein JXQ73_33505 [Phycisphaerae bacterium]|nr:hypothetical protein [Phycisphaerae bacterium]
MVGASLHTIRGVRGGRRGGYTLMELVVSTAAMGVLTTAIASSVLIATHSIDDDQNPSASIRRSTLGTDDLIRDVSAAKAVNQDSILSMSFTVPDRTGDAVDDILRYSWTGVAGDPLVRQINGGTAATLLENVRGLYMALHMNQIRQNETSAEQYLIGDQSSGSSATFAVSGNNWIGQYFKPSLPTDAVSWSITRVQFHGGPHAPILGIAKVQIRSANALLVPSKTVLEEVSISESALGPIYDPPEEVAFNTLTGLAPGEGLCLVITQFSDVNPCDVHYQSSGASPSGSYMVKTTNAGSSWTKPSGQSMWFKVYGTVTVPGTGLTNGTKIEWLRVSVVAGVEFATRIDAAVQMVNKPELTGP